MDFNDYGTMAEIFSAATILITLIYGIMQLRINNKLARVELTQKTATGLLEFYVALGSDVEAARIWREGIAGGDLLSPDETTQFTLLCTAAFIGFETQFRLQQERLIAHEFFDRGDRQVKFMMD